MHKVWSLLVNGAIYRRAALPPMCFQQLSPRGTFKTLCSTLKPLLCANQLVIFMSGGQVTVTVAGQTKGTAATEGVESTEWEETLEFAVPGDVADGDDEQARLMG